MSNYVFIGFTSVLKICSVNRFELLQGDRSENAKVTDFFGSERKILPFGVKNIKIENIGPIVNDPIVATKARFLISSTVFTSMI